MTHSIELGTTDVLEVCETMKLACAELYHYFGDVFKEDREVFLLWLKIAMEEENHARLFALVRKLRRNNIVESIQVELVEAEVTVLYVRALIKKVKKHPPSLEEALGVAIDLEIKLNGFLLENVVHFDDQSYGKSFLGSTNSGSSRRDALQQAYARVTARG